MADTSGENDVALGSEERGRPEGRRPSKAKRLSEESLSTDSAILRKVRETEGEVQEGTREVQLLKERIAELRDRIPVTEEDEKAIGRAQERLKDKVRALELLMKRISMLLERRNAVGGAVAEGAAAGGAFAGVCVKCGLGAEACACEADGARVCICLPAGCICRKGKGRGKGVIHGRWRGHQTDPFPVHKPRCVCVKDGQGICTCIGNLDEECSCRQHLRDMEACDCRREDHPALRR